MASADAAAVGVSRRYRRSSLALASLALASLALASLALALLPARLRPCSIVGLVMLLVMSDHLARAAVALGAARLLHATGIADPGHGFAAFADPMVLVIASLFAMSASRDAAGIRPWARQRLIRQAAKTRTRLHARMMPLAGGLRALIGGSGAVAALLAVVVLVAARRERSPWCLPEKTERIRSSWRHRGRQCYGFAGSGPVFDCCWAQT